MKPRRKKFRRLLKVLLGIILVLVLAVLIYFPGHQTLIAFTLATGVGVDGLQSRVDQMEDKAITGKAFTDDDKQFLHNLYTCFAKGGRLTIVLRQSSQMMYRYLSVSGDDLNTAPRVFINSQPVQGEMAFLKRRIVDDFKTTGAMKDVYTSDTFYMGDPEFYDSYVGLYFGHIIATPTQSVDGSITIDWRAECPWEWPSYESLYKKYGEHHAQCFPLPNAKSLIFGSEHCLWIDDGLGGHLATEEIAKPFLVYSEWSEVVNNL